MPKQNIIMNFYVIDFENSNSDNSSICQVGLVKYSGNGITDILNELIDPESEFSVINQRLHGITVFDVEGCMKFPELYNILKQEIRDELVFNHNGSDKSKFIAACKKYKLEPFNIEWLNSASLVRKTWKQFENNGYGLSNICKHLEIECNEHDAISDARATAEVILKSCEITGYSINDWKNILTAPVNSDFRFAPYGPEQKISGDLTVAPDLNLIEDKDNPFYGRKVVISGTYKSWPNRRDLAKLLKSFGADIDTNVSNTTDILCKGVNAGPKKIEKMVARILDGESVQILEEDQILKLLIQIVNR